MPEKPDDYLAYLPAACMEIGELAWLLSEVVRLDEQDGVTFDGLQRDIRRIARQARDHPSVQKAGKTNA